MSVINNQSPLTRTVFDHDYDDDGQATGSLSTTPNQLITLIWLGVSYE